ncbi:MarR family winged helix-turn-helix transcriptional regulator [Tabrizicola sp.]|uniref:MarR family winged helix-turn-helix transcriptional regulator n=1 Tax=Tabrizicola sp. TaxID=2005166 RepID=UPI003F2D6917
MLTELDGRCAICASTLMDMAHPFNCLTFNLQRATRRLMRGFEAAAKDSGLTAPQFTTLSLMAGYGQASVTQIADKMGTDRTTMTRNLDVLARKGWIAEVAAEDGRLHVWTLTDAGQERLRIALPAWRAFQAGLIDKMGNDTAEALLKTLGRL